MPKAGSLTWTISAMYKYFIPGWKTSRFGFYLYNRVIFLIIKYEVVLSFFPQSTHPKKNSHEVWKYIKKRICTLIHISRQTNSLKMVSSNEDCKDPPYRTAVLSGHFQQLNRNRLQNKFWVVVFLINNICSKR